MWLQLSNYIINNIEKISTPLVVACLLNIYKTTFCLRFSVGFRTGDWVCKSSVLMFGSSCWWSLWCYGMTCCHPETWDKNWCGNRSCAHGTPPTISLRGSFAAKFRHFELNTSQRDLYRPTCTFGTARQTGGRCSHRRTEPVRHHHTKQMMLRVWSCLLRNSLTKETFWLVS